MVVTLRDMLTEDDGERGREWRFCLSARNLSLSRSLLEECRREIRRSSCVALEATLGLDGGT
jgi:hypothetical protein